MIVTRLIRAGLALTAVGALTGGVGATPSLAREASASVVPYQFVSKLYTEGLGRLPSQSEWRSGVRHFSRSGCGPASLAVWGCTCSDRLSCAVAATIASR